MSGEEVDGLNNANINNSYGLPSPDQWLHSQGVIMQNPEVAIHSLIQRAKSKQVTTLREKGFVEHQNGNYDEAVEIFTRANKVEKEKQYLHQQISPRWNANKKEKQNKYSHHKKANLSVLKNTGKKVVVFTQQPLFGFKKMKKGSIIVSKEETINKYNPERSKIVNQISPRATSSVVKTESFFARSAEERERYKKYILERKRQDAIEIQNINRQNKSNKRNISKKKKKSAIERRNLKEKQYKREMQKLYVTNGFLLNEKNGPSNFVEDYDDDHNDKNGNFNAIGAYKMHNKGNRKRILHKKRKATHKFLQIPSVNTLEQGSKESPRIVATKEESLILKNENE